MDALLVSLRRIRRRLLLVRAVEAGLAGTVGAAELAVVVTVIRLLMPQHVPVAAAHPALPLVLLPCGFLIAMVWRLLAGVTLRQAAMAADEAAGLQERLTTALEVIERSSPGLLDERLLEQARAAAAIIDPKQLRLARTMPRTGKVVAVAVLVLVAGALAPPMGGPAVAPPSAQRATSVLQEAAAKTSLSSPVRDAIESAVRTLQESGVRQAAADQATAAILDSMQRTEKARTAIAADLAKAESPELAEMLRRAEQGDLEGARRMAEAMGLEMTSPDSSAGPADRERVAAGLSGAAQTARREDLPSLAAEMEAAAAALRRSGPETAAALQRLAEELADSLRRPSPGDVAAVSLARLALGLPELPAPALPPPVGVPAEPANAEHSPRAVEAGASPAIHPEDQDVVRRYFGE
jgi:hypothetical protein